jgi:hypothetical protein
MNTIKAQIATHLIRERLSSRIAILVCCSGVPMHYYIRHISDQPNWVGVAEQCPSEKKLQHFWNFEYDFEPGEHEMAAEVFMAALPERATIYVTYSLAVIPDPVKSSPNRLQLLTDGVIILNS